VNKEFVTFADFEVLKARIHEFALAFGINDDDATMLIVERYFSLSFKQRERIEKNFLWRAHRNKGFRSLPQFLKPKKQRKKPTGDA